MEFKNPNDKYQIFSLAEVLFFSSFNTSYLKSLFTYAKMNLHLHFSDSIGSLGVLKHSASHDSS
jgi:hypothetical protein